MNIVYVVTKQDRSEFEVLGVFTNYHTANQWIHDTFTDSEGVTSEEAFNCNVWTMEVK